MHRLQSSLRSFVPVAVLVAAVLPVTGQDATLPSGGVVSAGSGSVSQSGNQLTITQGSDRLIMDWSSFNIGENAGVRFDQPGASSAALNRIHDQNPSQILGSLSANGQVFLVNSSGIYFGKNATVNVGGVIASSLDISDADFLNGSYRFSSQGGAGSVTNRGRINAAAGGVVALISPVVSNEGAIEATNGSVALAAGNKVNLDFAGDGLITLTVDEAAVDAQAGNKGLIKSDGGLVIMTSRAANQLAGTVINNSGVIEANTLTAVNGRIILDGGDLGVVENTGTLAAKGGEAGEAGGSIVMTGQKVGLLGQAVVDASGMAGGGSISIGGGFQGNDASVRNAKRTYIASNTMIHADAWQNGDGGKVVVWSDEITRFYGNISAKGGVEAGNGGFVEVSGKNALTFAGAVNASAGNGTAGTLLLDPKNIKVEVGGMTNLEDADAFADNAALDSVVAPSAITAVTNGGTAVTLQASNDITVNSAIVSANNNAGINGGKGGNLVFQAGRHITLHANIYSDDGDVSFTVNDSFADGANRDADPASFTNNSLVDAGSGSVSITMDSGTAPNPTSGTINTGQITAHNLTITHNGPTAGAVDGQIDLGETEIANNLTITANSARNLLNSVGTVTVRNIASFSVGAGDITITRGTTDLNILRATAANLTINDANAVQIGTTSTTGNYTLTTKGPMASYGTETMTIGGTTTLSAGDGGFGYADPYISLPNENDFQGSLILTASSTGPTGTGGWATIKDINALTLGTVSLGSNFTVTSGGSGGDLVGNSTITVPRQTTITAQSGGNVTLDNASNDFGHIRVVSAKDVTLVDANGIVFGSYNGYSGFGSTISGDLKLTAGGDISQYNWGSYEGYSQISVAGTTAFTAANALSPISLYLGPTDPFFTNSWGLGQQNNFAGTVTLARTNGNTGFTNVYLRNVNSNASVLAGLTTVGSLNNVFLKYDAAPAVTLPGMTLGGQLKVYAPSVANTASVPGNIIQQTGPIVVASDTMIQASSTGDIELTNAGNDFGRINVIAARDAKITDLDDVVLYGNGYRFTVSRDLNLVAGGAVTDGSTSNADYYISVGGVATFTVPGNNIVLDNYYNRWNTVGVVAANNVEMWSSFSSFNLNASTIAGTLHLQSNNYNLTQTAGQNVTVGGNTSFIGFNTINLPSTGNVFGALYIDYNTGSATIREDDAITQSAAWDTPSKSFNLTTSNGQAITLTQAGNRFGVLNLTQAGADTTTAASGDVSVTANYHLYQSAAWNVHGRTTLNITSGYSLYLQNANNVFGPMRVSSSGTTYIYGKDWTDSASAFHAAITDVGGPGAWSTGYTELRAYNTAGATATGTINLTNAANTHGDLTLYGGPVTITENSDITDWSWWATTTGTTMLNVAGAGRQIFLDNPSNQIGAIAIGGAPSAVTIYESHNIDQASAWLLGTAPVYLYPYINTAAINLTQAGNVLGAITIYTDPNNNRVPASVNITEDDAITQGNAWTFQPNSGTITPVTLITTNGQAISIGGANNLLGNLTITQNGAGTGAVSIREIDTAGITQAGAWTTRGTTTLDTNAAINLPNAANILGPITVNGAYTPTAVTITENHDITQASAWSVGTAPVSLNAGTNQILMTQANNVLGHVALGGAASFISIRENDPITQSSLWNIGTTPITLATSNDQAITLNQNNVLGGITLTQYNTGASSFGDVLVTENDGNGITQSGAWTTHGVTTLNAGSNPVVLTQAANVLANVAFTGTPSAVSLTENDAITQNTVWSLGTAPVSLITTNSQAISLGGQDNVFGNLTVTQNGAGSGAVVIRERDTTNGITQGGSPWLTLGATTIDASGYGINLSNANNVFGPLQLIGGTSGGTTVTLFAKQTGGRDAISDVGGAGAWTTGTTTLHAYGTDGTTLGGGNIILTNASNSLGDLNLKGATVTVTENGSITDGAAGWQTTGTTTFNPGANGIVLDNAANTLGAIAINSAATAVTINEAEDITQASAWNLPLSPVTLSAVGNSVFLTQALNQLGDLKLTAQNVSVVENHAITDSSAWTVPGSTSLTAGANAIALDANPRSNFGTMTIVSASNADIADINGIVFDGASVSGTLTVTAGGAITQTANAITAASLVLNGTGASATLNAATNDVDTLSATFTAGGGLAYTDADDVQILAASVGANAISFVSISGSYTGLNTISSSTSSLTFNTGAALTVPALNIAGAQSYTAGGGGITLDGNLNSTAAGAIAFNSAVTLSRDLTVSSTNSPITFFSTVAGGTNDLGVNAGNSAITFKAAVSNLGDSATSNAALSVTATSGATIFESTLAANNGLLVSGPSTFQDSVTLQNGGIGSTFTGEVTLGKAGGMTLSGYKYMDFNSGIVLAGGDATILTNGFPLRFNGGTVHGPFGLTLDAGNGESAVITGLTRMGADLTRLTATSYGLIIPASGITINGPQSYTSTSDTITLTGNLTSTSTGAITFHSPVNVTGTSTITTDNSNVVFENTLDGTRDLTIASGSGAKSFLGKVGSLNSLGDGTGAALILQGSGAANFSDTVVMRSGMTSAGAVSFAGDVALANGDTASTFTGRVTTGGSLASIGGYDGIAFDGGLTLGGDLLVTSNGGTISFGNTVLGAHSLTLNALAGGAGTVTGFNQVDSNLTGLYVTAHTLSLPASALSISGPLSFTAAGGITLNGNVVSTGSGQIDFNGPIVLATNPISITTGNAPIVFNGTVNGGQALYVDAGTGTTTFVGAVGGSTPLSSLSLASGGTTALNGGAVMTTGAQNYGSALSLGANTTLAGSAINFGSTINGAYTLLANVPGATTFNGAVGGTTPLVSITTDAAGSVVFNTTAITTSGAQVYNELATLGADLVLTGANLRFAGPLDGAHGLTLNASGTIQFDSAVGATTPLTSLTAVGNTLGLDSVTTTGAQSYTGAVALDGNLTTSNANITVTGPMTLGSDVTISTGVGAGDITFAGPTSTINGAHALVLSAGIGNIVLGGQIGGITPLGTVDVGGYDLTVPVIHSSGLQTYSARNNLTLSQSRTSGVPQTFTADSDGDGSGAFILSTGVTLTTTNQPLTITAADIDLQGTSTINTGTGLITFTPSNARNLFIGGTDAAGQMTITANELSRISTSGGIDFLTTGTGWIKVASIGASDSQNIAGVLRLYAQGSGDVSFVTGASTFNALTARSGTGSILLEQNLTTTGDPIVFASPAAANGSVTVASGGGSIDVQSTFAANNPTVFSTAGGALGFGGNVTGVSTLAVALAGGTVSGLDRLQSTLTGFTLSSNATVTLPAIAIDGPQTYNGPVSLSGDLTGTGLTFNNTVQFAANNLTLAAGTGTIAFNNTLSAGANNLTLTADEIDFANTVTGTGSFVLQPSTNNLNVVIGGSAATAGLDLTAADLGWLPSNLGGLALGRPAGTGTLSITAATNFGTIPLTLNGGGGISQAGALTATGVVTLRSANAIDLADVGNNLGAIAIAGTPTSVSITDTSWITQAAPWVLGTAPVTLTAVGSDILLSQDGNTFGTLRLIGGSVDVREAADTDLGASTTTTLNVISTGAISTSGTLAIASDALFTTLNDAGGAITLGNNSTFGSLSARSRNAANTADAAGAISIAPGASTLLKTFSTAGNISFIAAGGTWLGQDGTSTLNAFGLELLGLGDFSLLAGTNAITTLAGNTGNVAFRENSGFAIGTVNTVGLTSSGNITLSSTGAVTQSEKIAASGLELLGVGGSFVLGNSDNAITTLAGDTGHVSFVDNSGFAVGTVNTVGLTTSGNTTLSSTGAVTQLQKLVAHGLELLGAGGRFMLMNPANAVTTLAGNTGEVSFLENSGFDIGTVNTVGLVTSGSTTLSSTGAVTQSQDLQVGSLELLGAGGVYSLDRDTNTIPVLAGNTGSASVHTSGTLEIGSVNTAGFTATADLALAAAGAITQTQDLTIGRNLSLTTTHNAGDVTINNNGASATRLGDTTVGGDYVLTASNGPVSQVSSTAVLVVGDFTVNSPTAILDASGNLIGGTTNLPASTSSTIRQAGVITLGNRTEAGDLTVVSEATNRSFSGGEVNGTAVNLNRAGNAIGGAISVTTLASGVITGTDVQTGIVQTPGTSLNIAGVASFTAESSTAGSLGIILANDGNSFGQLRVTGNIIDIKNSAARTTEIGSALATTSFTLVTADAVTQTGAIVTPTLTIASGGSITLDNALNDTATLIVDANGAISYRDTNGFAIDGLNARGHNVSLAAGGTGGLTQTAALANVAELSLTAGGAITLTHAGNAIDRLKDVDAAGVIQIFDAAGGLTVEGAVQTSSGGITVRTSGDLTLATGTTVTASSGDICLSTEGAGQFINNAGSSALSIGGGNRWLVYSKTPDLVGTVHTEKGGLTSSFRLYGKTFGSDAPAAIAELGNGFIYADSPLVTLTVTPTITGAASHIYGDTPTGIVGYTVSTGFIDSEDTVGSIGLSGTALFDVTLANTMNAGLYSIHYTGGLSAKYTLVADASGVGYTVTKAPLTYIANPATRIYGDSDPAFGGTVNGFKLGQSVADLTGSALWTSSSHADSSVGSYAIVGSGYSSDNYSFAQAVGNSTAFTITPATLTVTADSQTKVYGDADPLLTYLATGYKLTDDAATVLNGSLTRAVGETVAGGPYAINQGTLVANGNYTLSYNGAALTITPAGLTVTADSQTKGYGASDPAFTYVGSGYKFADTAASVLGGSLTRAPGETVAGGPYAIGQGTLSANSNYTLTFVGNSLTITPATLTVTADSQTKVYGSIDPALTYTVNGYMFADDAASVLSGALTRAPGENVNDGPFAIGQGTLTANSNYTLNFTGSTLTLTPRAITVTADNQSRTYGDANPSTGTFAVGGGGLVNGDTLDAMIAVSTPATLESNVGAYALAPGAVSFTSGEASNYAVTYANGTLTIAPRAITVTADNQSRTYGDANPVAGTFVLGGSGLVNGDSLASLVSLSSSADAVSSVGSYNLTPSAASFTSGSISNYTITYVDGMLAVSPRPITLTADNQTRLYGDANPAVGTFVISGRGLANSDSIASLISLSTPATSYSHVGTYSLSPNSAVFTSGSAANYTLTYADGSLAVTPRPITLTADNQSRVYGETNPDSGTFSVGGSGLATGDSLAGMLDVSSPALTTSNVGSYGLTPSGVVFTSGVASDYTITYVDGSLAVTARPITISPTAQSRTYGDPNPGSGGFVLGSGSLVNADELAATILVSSPATATSNAGSYALTPGAVSFTRGSASNYAITYTEGALEVTPAVLTYTANAASRVYGDGNPVFSGNVTGFRNGEDLSSATTGAMTFASTADVFTYAGSHVIEGSGLVANHGNYTFVQAPSNATALLITPRPLTVSTSSLSRVYGDPNPVGIAVVATGLVNGDTISGADITSAAAQTSNIGTYSYVPSDATFSVGSASNYAITYSGGTLTVTPRPITVTADNQSRVYGDGNPTMGTFDITSGSLANSDSVGPLVTLASAATVASNVGSYALTPGGLSFTNGSTANYTVTYANGVLAITPAVLTYTANSATRVYGDANPVFSGSVTGFKNGDTLAEATSGTLVFDSTATVAANVGTYEITGGGLSANHGNYIFVQAPGNAGALTITPRPLTVGTSSHTRVYGDSNPNVVLVTVGLVNGDTLAGAAITNSATAASNVGSYGYSTSNASFATGLSSNYAITYSGGTLTITPRPITVTAVDQSRLEGVGNPTVGSVVADDLVNGDSLALAPLTTDATVESLPGQYSLTPTAAVFAAGNASNYAVTFASGKLVVDARAVFVPDPLTTFRPVLPVLSVPPSASYSTLLSLDDTETTSPIGGTSGTQLASLISSEAGVDSWICGPADEGLLTLYGSQVASRGEGTVVTEDGSSAVISYGPPSAEYRAEAPVVSDPVPLYLDGVNGVFFVGAFRLADDGRALRMTNALGTNISPARAGAVSRRGTQIVRLARGENVRVEVELSEDNTLTIILPAAVVQKHGIRASALAGLLAAKMQLGQQIGSIEALRVRPL